MLAISELLNPVQQDDSFESVSQGIARSKNQISHHVHQPLGLHSRHRQTADIQNQRILLPPPSTQGSVNFPPFENVDESTRQKILACNIPEFGCIASTCEHIPYNSSKKDFFAKTGRECIEAFKYTFQLPKNPGVFTIMWDYNIGLVRMTPFFKFMGYPKTRPSQMLDKNPGLRDICPSITGGAVSAQGYWMPYKCAKAMCATFCVGFADALIPLFGPGFPSECTPISSDYFGEMKISPELIEDVSRSLQPFLQRSTAHNETNYSFPEHSPRGNWHTPRYTGRRRPLYRGTHVSHESQPIYKPLTRRPQQDDDMSRTSGRSLYLPSNSEASFGRRSTHSTLLTSPSHSNEGFRAVKDPETSSTIRFKQKSRATQSHDASPGVSKRRKLSAESPYNGDYTNNPRPNDSARTSLPEKRYPRHFEPSGRRPLENDGVTSAANALQALGRTADTNPVVSLPRRRSL